MTRRHQIVLGLIAVAALASGYFVAALLRGPDTTPPAAPTAALPAEMIDFTLPDLDGRPHPLSEWKGKLIVLNFWATWCPPCRDEIPLFIEMQEKYGARGLQIVGVAIDKKEDIASFRDFNFISYPLLYGQEEVLKLMASYGNRIGSLPYSVVIGRDGKVLGRKVGAYGHAELDALLDSLLPAL
jgi:thiol-disulfide isomerase/thioredoxin